MLGEGSRPAFLLGAILAVAGLVAALALAAGTGRTMQAFLFAYLTAFAFFLSITLGALFFVLMQHLTAAGWSVGVRRIAEQIAALMPVLFALVIPILFSVALQKGTLYRWALPLSAATPEAVKAAEAGEPGAEEPETAEGAAQLKPELDSITLQKRKWLNPWFFILRVIIYFSIWTAMALWYRRRSIEQDRTKDPEATRRMQVFSGFCMLVLGLTLTGAAGDVLMSLDPHWYSTMWGVYYFAGSALVYFAVAIVAVYLLQKAGYLRKSITIEHYHDLGKYLFGFTFFWGYIAFSQYMLLWYANIPEEIAWFSRHGATTVRQDVNGWSWVIVAILFGQLLIPFAGLLSRYPKRWVGVLLFWALWVIAFHVLDTIWIVMPEYRGPMTPLMVAVLIAAFIGVGGVMLAALVRNLSSASLRPVADPRLPESLAFQNF